MPPADTTPTRDPQDNPDLIREIRINPVVPSQSVLVATARSLRPRKPEQPAPRDTRPHVETCPFCTGNEHLTPPTIAQWPAGQTWRARAVENLYPVLGNNDQLSDLYLGMQQVMDGYGHHEVIVDHPEHGIALHEMQPEHVELLLGAYRDRMETLLESDPRISSVLVFKNFGPAAGGSMPHTHSQLVAMPVVPANILEEVTSSATWHGEHGRCVFCDLIDEATSFETTIYNRETGKVRRQITPGQYVIARNEHFVAIKPFASRYEWEVHLLPVEHASDYTSLAPAAGAALAQLLVDVMGRIDRVTGGAQYNFFLHSQPRGPGFEHCADSYHWHMEICPRTSIPSGFELGSGLFVNTVSPELAARRLREAGA